MKGKSLFFTGKTILLLLPALLSVVFSFGQNAIVTENSLPGNPASEWDISGSGSSAIQGFGTDISVNKGQRINFKINTSSTFTYTIKIYRIGYYQGNGARLIASLGTYTGTVQPTPITNTQTGLVDCGNWSVSAFWDVPSTAVSGVYIARIARSGSSGTASHIIFIVRDDNSHSDLFFQTSDATWQAYNVWGGNSLYYAAANLPNGHASKVSYNRPFITRDGGGGGGVMEDWFFSTEYPMIRFLERNGYDMTYTTNVDMARRGNLALSHKIFLSVGHDEYWSAEQRNNVETARSNGIHLAFFSGNEVYWKTRWENSADGSNTPYRTLVCYKEGSLGELGCGGKCDPSSEWTGLWRDGCSYPSAGGCKPENALTGEISWDGGAAAIQVSSAYKNLAFWRNTSVASLGSGQSITLPMYTLGHEWDYEQYQSSYPANRVTLSSTVVNGKTHKLSLYTHSSGAMVFGAGTCQWSWGLDETHDREWSETSIIMQQATVNLLGDMGAQPGSIMAGLIPTSTAPDVTPPVVAITSPAHNSSLPQNIPVTITGTASDAGGTVSNVEISVNGGNSWQNATGTNNWTYAWTPTAGTANIKVRATDNHNNTSVPGANGSSSNITVTVTATVDNTPPVTTITSPVNGASVYNGIPLNITGTASDEGGAVSSVEVSVNGGSSWQAATGTTNWNYSWTPASTGSANIQVRGKDNSGNTETPGAVGSANNISINVVAAPAAANIFQSTDGPSTGRYNDGTALELGVKFRSTVNGYITGIRYYKPATTTGTHVGNLWSSGGTKLASATFTSESASGWQQVLFSTPVAIDANTTYVASCFSPSGDYVVTDNYFTSAVVNGSIRGLADGEDGPNGLYRYTSASAFPNTGYQASNYWIDIVFANSVAPQLSAPAVTTQPTSKSVCAGSNVTFTSAASGSPTPTVQWQVSTDGGTNWTNISGATNASLTFVAATGDDNKKYRAVWTNSEGTANSTAATLTVSSIPAAPAVTVTNNCGNSVLTAANYTGALLWSTGATTASITVTSAGTYTVTQTINGCASPSGSGTAAPINSSIAAPTVTVTNNCGSSVLTASNYTGTLLWSTGETTASVTVASAGTYSVTQTVNGCASPAKSATAAPKAIPATPTISTVNNCGSSVLTAGGSTGTYTWNTGATTASITITASGTYSVTATNAGCTSAPATIQANVSSGAGATAATISSATSAICINSSTASLTLNVTGGTGPYQAVINGTTYNNISNGGTISVPVSAGGVGLWNTTPSVISENDGTPVERGLKFKSSVSGYIAGIRFYKKSNNDGTTHILKLYQYSNQSLLASAPYTGTTDTGWRSVNFASPIAVTANTVYVATCYSPSGNYVGTIDYFTSSAYTNGSLTALKNGTNGNNGAYRYGSGFPTTGYRSTNYWIDVIFIPSTTISLQLTSVKDANGCGISGNLDTVTLQVTNCTAARSSEPVTLNDPEKQAPQKLELDQNRPNPFEASSVISIGIPQTYKVKLTLYDINGKILQVLMDEIKDPGYYTVPVERKGLAAGIYYYKLEAGGETLIRKMTIL